MGISISTETLRRSKIPSVDVNKTYSSQTIGGPVYFKTIERRLYRETAWHIANWRWRPSSKYDGFQCYCNHSSFRRITIYINLRASLLQQLMNTEPIPKDVRHSKLWDCFEWHKIYSHCLADWQLRRLTTTQIRGNCTTLCQFLNNG